MHMRVENKEIRKPSSMSGSLMLCVKGKEASITKAQQYETFTERFHSAARLGLN